MKKRKDGYYQMRVLLGHDRDGKPITKLVYGKTQKEAKAKADALKGDGVQEKHNFGKLNEEMLDEKEKTVSYNTYKVYKENCAKISELFDLNIEDITIADVQSIINNAYKKGFSKSILLKIRLVYSMTVNHAVEKGIKATNFSQHIKIPKNAPKKKVCGLSDDEIDIIENAVNDEFGLYPFLMLNTGLRKGEICALTWDDINLDKKAIYIKKAIVYIGNRPMISNPKTTSGVRCVPILDNVLPYLSPGKKSMYIFGGEQPYTQTMICKRWKKYILQHGMNISQHQLRHSYATMLYKAGIHPKTAQGLLGHADVQTTLNIYTDIADEIQAETYQALNVYKSKK